MSVRALTRHHVGEQGVWSRVEIGSAPALRAVAHGVRGFVQQMRGHVVHRAGPIPSVVLMLAVDTVHDLALADGARLRCGSFLAGLTDRHVMVGSGGFEGIQLDLSPAAACVLLDRPVAELARRVEPLDDTEWGELAERMGAEPDWSARAQLVEDEVARRLAVEEHTGRRHRLRRLDAAVSQLVADDDGGRARGVGGVAAGLGWSPRRMRAAFADELGIAPKPLARVARAARAAELCRRSGPTLAGIAVVTGYADQAHMTRELRATHGVTPGALRAAALPDDGGVFEPGEAADPPTASIASS